MAYVSKRWEGDRWVRTWEELTDTREGLTAAGGRRSHKCTRGREDKVGRKRHIYYWTLVAGGVVKCGSTKRFIKEKRRAKGLSGHEYKRRAEDTAPV